MRRLIMWLLMAAVGVLVAGCAAGGSSLSLTNPSLESEDAAAPVLSWQREGGFAGFCDEVLVYDDGLALIKSCRPPETTREVTLTPEQLQQIEAWAETYTTFTHEQADAAAADGIAIVIQFEGRGAAAVTPELIEAMSRLAEQLIRQHS